MDHAKGEPNPSLCHQASASHQEAGYGHFVHPPPYVEVHCFHVHWDVWTAIRQNQLAEMRRTESPAEVIPVYLWLNKRCWNPSHTFENRVGPSSKTVARDKGQEVPPHTVWLEIL